MIPDLEMIPDPPRPSRLASYAVALLLGYTAGASLAALLSAL